MNYSEIDEILSRVSFDSKMNMAFAASIQTMSVNGQVEASVLRKSFLPDEIETFVLKSVVTEEYGDDDLTVSEFNGIMNVIREYQPPQFYNKLKTDHLKWILPTIGAVQFESQQYLLFRLYRHHYLFSFFNENVDVGKAFMEKFEKSFDEYANIVYCIHLFLAEKELDIFQKLFNTLSLKYNWFLKNLKLTRKRYIEELNQFSCKDEDYRYCLRPSYSYPFIEYDQAIFLPTPHLLIQSITTAMMNRLTFGNNDLREKIGKNACEGYLYDIVVNSGLFDEVKPEYEYSNGKKTLDVMTRKGEEAVLFDSKLFSPKANLRNYDEEAYKKDVSRILKTMKQAYIHARKKFNNDYCPFLADVKDVFAIVVVYQDGYIDYNDIYKNSAYELSIEEGSEEYDWFSKHIGITDIATIERFLLTGTDIMPEIRNRNARLYQWLTGNSGSNLKSDVLKYNNKLIADGQIFWS